MSDYGHEQTDKELKRIENLISKEYSQAAKELEDKMLKQFESFNARDVKMRAKLKAGEITQTEYNNWLYNQVATGDRWRSLRDSMVNTLVDTDKAATTIIQGNSIKAYADNMNYSTYKIEHDSKINTGFTLYDENTVKNLLKEDPKIIPMPKVDILKDELWNRQHLTSAVTQGILQGESIPQIADRLQNVAFMGRNSAIRNARTYTTAAENKGRIDSYERAEKLGIQTNKKWIATLDEKTRAEHRHLDGMSVPYKEDFKVDGYTISFPGDPSAKPEMFYNCRCTLVDDIVGYPYNDERKDDKLGDMTYEEWKHAKDKESKEETKEEPVKEEPKELKLDKLEKVMKEKDFQDFYDLVDNAENRKLYEMFGNEGLYTLDKKGGYYSPVGNSIHFSYNKGSYEGVDKYSTLAHESGHKFSFMIGDNEKINHSEIDYINEKCRGNISVDRIKPTASNSDEFLSALRLDMENLKPLLVEDENEFTHSSTTKMYEYLSGKTKLGYEMFKTEADYNASGGVQDALDGFYHTLDKGLTGWGHGDRYYNGDYNKRFDNREKELKSALTDLGFDATNQKKVKDITRQYMAAEEAWANVNSAITTNGKELEMMEKFMPNTVDAYRKIVEVL